MNIIGSIAVDMKPVQQIIRAKGLDASGAVQRFHSNNAVRRLTKYMPYRAGVTIKLMLQNVTDTQITVPGPYAKYLYYGKAMEGRAPKTVTNRDLNYIKTKNALAGPFPDRRLMAAERKVIQRELQDYVRRRG